MNYDNPVGFGNVENVVENVDNYSEPVQNIEPAKKTKGKIGGGELYKVVYEKSYIRDNPSYSGNRVETLKQGDELNVVKIHDGGWAELVGGGYVKIESIEKQ